jgi:hypothetical protein
MSFLGHLDGVPDGQVFGWAWDSENPDATLHVTIHLNQQRVINVLAPYYRRDVAETLSCSGRHGFYVDLSRYSSERGAHFIIDARFPNGELIDGSPLHAYVPPRQRSHKPTLLFMHIPKTAGTAFREAALESYKQAEAAFIYRDPPGFAVELRDMPEEQLAGLRFVVGHFVYGLHDGIPNHCRYFTILRNPVDRVWSQYTHWLREGSDVVRAEDGRRRSIEELLENKMNAELDNAAVRYIAGIDWTEFPAGRLTKDVYELAVHNLERSFVSVGLQEQLPDSYDTLRREFSWMRSAPPEIMNAGGHPNGDALPEKEKKLAAHFNHWDMKLYKHAQTMLSSCVTGGYA